jgi:short-subunit dehydrogenase
MSLALVTGASTGIGRELALVFARDGYDLVLVARNEDALSDVADRVSKPGRAAHVFAADLSEPTSAGKLHERLAAAGITVDVLVNNAGVGARGGSTRSQSTVSSR